MALFGKTEIKAEAQATVAVLDRPLAASKKSLSRMTDLPKDLTFAPVAPVSDVALKAAELLGYNGAKYAEERRIAAEAEPAKRYADECALFDACVAAGIRPFQREAVNAYKHAKLAEKGKVDNGRVMYNDGWWAWNRRLLGRGPRHMLGQTAVFAQGTTQEQMAAYFAAQQQETDLYPHEVPEGVLRLALNLKEKLPEVTFQIDGLEYYQRPADPFLVAKFGLAEFYIAVWDEPSFKAKYE